MRVAPATTPVMIRTGLMARLTARRNIPALCHRAHVMALMSWRRGASCLVMTHLPQRPRYFRPGIRRRRAAGGGSRGQDAGSGLVEPPSLSLLAPVMVSARRLLTSIITHMTIGDARRLAADGVVRCLIYVRIS